MSNFSIEDKFILTCFYSKFHPQALSITIAHIYIYTRYCFIAIILRGPSKALPSRCVITGKHSSRRSGQTVEILMNAIDAEIDKVEIKKLDCIFSTPNRSLGRAPFV